MKLGGNTIGFPPLHKRISILPPELLIEIFANCASNETLAPLTLRRVSKWWRAIINSSPRVWQSVYLDDQAHSIFFLRTQAEIWAQRSMPLAIDVQLNVVSVDLILPMLSPLLPFVDRWRSFSMEGQRKEYQVFPKGPLITVNFLNYLRIYIQESTGGITFTPEVSNCVMHIWLLALPPSTLLSPLRFTTVEISEENINVTHSRPQDILDFLCACPELEAFHYTGWQYNDDPPSNPLPVISLPNLHTLRLKNICIARQILSSLYVPRLANLSLAHLNVEFTLRGEYHEDGDSDDEANDFSQSPSSDHATGMGLRKLISRSQPPITMLDMDFSDMRTKDFKYMFDRLPLLQRFFIVASDMSDTVIRLLRPYTLPGDDVTVHTRLPHLRSLSLYNCQQLSGEAVVEVLAERVAHTDNHLFGTDTLHTVAIVTCDGFKPEHGQLLTNHLGSRLRLS